MSLPTTEPFVALMCRYCIDYTSGHDLSVRDDIMAPGSGDRMALRFTEHGASARHDGARAAWGGVGLYRWDGQRLLGNYVEQDYFARRRQLAGDGPDPVEPPG